jgi:hypothetical protein
VRRLCALAALVACDWQDTVGAEHTVAWPGDRPPCDPLAAEICNGRDDDCDGSVDEGDVCDGTCRAVRLSSRCALRSDGELYCWGIQAGSGTPFNQTTPLRLAIREPVVQVSAPCARTASGRAYCWGATEDNYLADQPPVSVARLGNTVAEVESGARAWGQSWVGLSCARRLGPWAGTLWCWDEVTDIGNLDDLPQPLSYLGNDVVEVAIGRVICVRKRDGSVWCSPPNDLWKPLAPIESLGRDNLRLAVDQHLCVLKQDRSVTCLGWSECEAPFAPPSPCAPVNSWGELGTGDTLERSGPVVASVFGRDVRSVSVGDAVTCVVKENGSAVCAGRIRQSQTAGTVASRGTIPVGLESDVEEVVPNCARKRDGSVWCWGDTPGDGSRSSAVPVSVDICPERES